ncbi:MAG: PaaI family thioesterase [Bacteroidetes bacterium]|nr:PaaI family thioesterase [Bacteroidota bacterium]
MYLTANSQQHYDTTTIDITDEKTTLTLKADPKYFHALDAVHGSVYFKLLDDASFFSVNANVNDVFVLTTNFNIQLLKPVNSGLLTAIGKARFTSKNHFVGDAELYNEEGVLIAYGTGNFSRSKIALTEEIGYKL